MAGWCLLWGRKKSSLIARPRATLREVATDLRFWVWYAWSVQSTILTSANMEKTAKTQELALLPQNP